MKRTVYVFILLILFGFSHAYAALEPVVKTEEAFGISSIAVSSNGSYIAAAFEDGSLRIFDAATGRQTAGPYKMNGEIKSVALAGDTLFVASDRIYLLNINNGQMQEFAPVKAGSIACDAAGTVLAVSLGNVLSFYNISGKTLRASVKTPSELTGVNVDIALRRVYTTSKDGFIRSYSIDSGILNAERKLNLGSLYSLSRSAEYVAVGGENGSAVLHTDLAGDVVNLSAHTDSVRSVALTPDGRYAITGGDDGSCFLWVLGTSNMDGYKLPQSLPVKHVAVDPYFRYAVAGTAFKDGKGAVLHIQYISAKQNSRRIYVFRDGQLTLTQTGYVDGTGSFAKYINYKDGNKTFAYNDVKNVVTKADKMIEKLTVPNIAFSSAPSAKKQTFKDITPPVITVNDRGLARVAANDIVKITGKITDDSGIAWAKADDAPLKLENDGSFKIELSQKSAGRILTISAADNYGNEAVKTLKTGIETKDTSGGKFALLIGINSYKHLPDLSTAEYDINVTSQILRQQYGYSTIEIKGSEATREKIISELNALRKNLSEKDSLIIYFAGHGQMDVETGSVYWQPYDSLPDDDTNWIDTMQISKTISAMKAKQILIVADSCFSGAFERPAVGSASRILITSGGVEPVSDIGKGGHSLFATAFIASLNSGNTDAENIYNYVKKQLSSAKQKPMYVKYTKNSTFSLR